jgi:hypothetical protein
LTKKTAILGPIPSYNGIQPFAKEELKLKTQTNMSIRFRYLIDFMIFKVNDD